MAYRRGQFKAWTRYDPRERGPGPRKKAAQKAFRRGKIQRLRGRAPVAAGDYVSMERKFLDPFTADGTKILIVATDSTLANAAGGFILTTAATPGALVLNQVPRDTSVSERIGRKIRLTAVRIKGMIRCGSAASNILKGNLALVWQKQPNNPTVMPPFTDLWVAQNPNSLRVVNNSESLRVLREWDWNLNGDNDAVTTGQEQQYFDFYVDLTKKDLVTRWTTANTDGGYDDMEEGALMLYSTGTAAEGTGSGAITFSARVYFNDF